MTCSIKPLPPKFQRLPGFFCGPCARSRSLYSGSRHNDLHQTSSVSKKSRFGSGVLGHHRPSIYRSVDVEGRGTKEGGEDQPNGVVIRFGVRGFARPSLCLSGLAAWRPHIINIIMHGRAPLLIILIHLSRPQSLSPSSPDI